MIRHKLINIVVSLTMISSLLLGSSSSATALPVNFHRRDEGPALLWTLSELGKQPVYTGACPVVIIGNGTGAEAVATVGANGAVTDITITNAGHNYSSVRVDILGSGTGATADVTIVKKGAVVAVTVDAAGTRYTAPFVTFSGSGGASGTAYGGVEPTITITSGGSDTFPTVDFDLPDGPNGVQAQGHAVMVGGVITEIVLDNPGSGYSTAPNVVIRDGTLFDPINNGGSGATATATLAIQEIVLDAFGSGYNSAPTVVEGEEIAQVVCGVTDRP